MSIETSIIIRTLNESKHLEKLLQGIHRQNYRDWEIILVDSGSTDGTLDIAQRYGVNIYHIPQKEFTFGRSLNMGCEKAQGRYLVFASGHVWPFTNNWLRNMIQPFQDPSVAMVYGRQRGTEATRLSELRDLDTQFGPSSNILIDEAKANNGNSAIRRDLWVEQPFDELLPGLEDVDWARKVEHKSYRVYYSADAGVYHIHEESLRQIYRRYLREAIAAKQMFPNYQFAWSDLVKGVPYFIVRDILYAFRHRKLGKVFHVPESRLAQFWGMYRGVRFQKRLTRQVMHRVAVPETHEKVVFEGPNHHGLQRSDIPQVGPDDVLVQVAYVGVGAQDLGVANGSTGRQEKVTVQYPVVPGNEYSGIVVRCGTKVSNLRKGQKVVGQCAIGCGHCSACEVGDHYSCTNGREPGGINPNGSYARYIAVNSKHVHKLPADMPLKQAVLVESVAMCLEGLGKLSVQRGRSVCVVGAGPMGNLCTQILHARGLLVTTVDQDPRWLRQLYKYDVDTLTELEEPDGYDYIIETAGNEEILPDIIEKSNSSAKVLLLGISCKESMQALLITGPDKDKVFSGSLARQRDTWRQAIRMVHSGIIRLDDHTATVEALEDYKKAWAGVEAGDSFKVLLRVSEELEAL